MRLGVLFSGGKDSALALFRAMKSHTISCLITIRSGNAESFMFHTPNINLTELQAEAMGIPLLAVSTDGEKEKELNDLRDGIKKAKELFRIEGIVTGAIESVYQATRIQKICSDLNLWCFNPLWQNGQAGLLHELIQNGFEVIIAGVFAFPLGRSWLGRKLDKETITELEKLKIRYKINPAGEGGEYESFVVNAPFFGKKIEIIKATADFKDNSGIYRITEARLR
jgi:ABC transporter with metal-binding/Fe-S-binding domain ATP-binding protein